MLAGSVYDDETLGPNASEERTMREIQRYVEHSFDRARIESERTFFNQQLTDEPYSANASILGRVSGTVPTDSFSQLRRGTPIQPGSKLNQPLEYVENVFAQKIDITLYKNCRAIIKESLHEAVEEIDEKDVTNLWRKAFAICFQVITENDDGVVEMRASRRWAEHVTVSSTKFLQDCYKEHMEVIVENALELANRGGVPGTIPLVEAYLNVKRIRYSGVEDGNYNNHPLWMVLFQCLRVGDFTAVGQLAKKLFNNSRCSIVASVLNNLHVSQTIESDTKIKLGAEWRQCSATCSDPFKKAVYGVLLGFDCPDVNGTIEDWLWTRLMCCRLNSQDMTESFRQLQNTVCSDFGEEYFVRQGGNYVIYYSALMLTGQIEQAVFALFQANLLVHAVHIAILAYQLKLLVLTPKISDNILMADASNPASCQLNFARIVLRYMKNFELTNINVALNYSFFLNKLELDSSVDDKGGRNVFMSCVSRLVYLTGERDQVLGKMDASGKRTPGLINKFSAAFNVTDVISYVATDTNICGDILEACKLFTLAEKPNDAIKLTCRLLSSRISAAAKCRNDASVSALNDAVTFAMALADRYETCTTLAVGKLHFSTMLMLLDCHTFFEQVAVNKYSAAMKIMQRLQFIPLIPEDVQSYVNAFEMVAEEVRLLLPEICIALMKTVVALYEKEPPESPQRAVYVSSAKTLILYTATVPYKFSVSTNSILLQLQSKIS